MKNKMNNKKVRKVLALTLGLGLAVGGLTGSYTIAQANQKPAEIQNIQTGQGKLIFDKADHQDLLKLLQIDEKAFRQDADKGMSLTEIAGSYHITRSEVVNVVVKSINQQINKELAEKNITVEQAKQLKANTVKKAQTIVDIKPIGFDDMNDKRSPQAVNNNQTPEEVNSKQDSQKNNPILQEMLTLLKIDAPTFQQEQSSGKSLAEIGLAHNVSKQAIVDLVTKDMNQQIDAGLAAKRITVEQAKEMKLNAVEEAQKMVDKSIKPQDKEDKGLAAEHATVEQANKTAEKTQKMNDKQNSQEMNKIQNSLAQEILTLLKIDVQTFEQEQNSGKSLTEIAIAHNVSRQAVVDLVVNNMNQQIDQGLAEKHITVEQANEMKTNAVQKAQEIVDKNTAEQPATPQK